ncbi:SDR family oxidoreductase [Microbulbifer sp. TYP-18]|uniref:SDR family oxidoreductase n=1 Tax=Microbulbifer sp. TYP-18 TaxID=3230024 RepID=UPI0034C673E2
MRGQSLAGKRLLITGAARGLGRAIAEAAAAEGAQLVLSDLLDKELTATAEALRSSGHSVETLLMDQGNPDAINSAMASLRGPLHGLINNAAVATDVGGALMEDYDLALWDRVMQVNVRGLWLTTRAALPLMEKAGGASVVNLASDTALWGAPKLMAYVASKGAVIAMTRAMARELGERQIRVNTIAPGLVRGQSTDYVPAERHRLYAEGRALKREQQPQDVCGSVLYLLSDWSEFVTGQLLPVNGGFLFN